MVDTFDMDHQPILSYKRLSTLDKDKDRPDEVYKHTREVVEEIFGFTEVTDFDCAMVFPDRSSCYTGLPHFAQNSKPIFSS